VFRSLHWRRTSQLLKGVVFICSQRVLFRCTRYFAFPYFMYPGHELIMSARIHVEHTSVTYSYQNRLLLKPISPFTDLARLAWKFWKHPTRDFCDNNISLEHLAASALRSRAFLSSRSKSVEYTTVIYTPYVFFHHSAVLGPQHNIRGNP